MKILFITRAYPPVVGGIEKQNHEIFTWLSKTNDIDLLANTKGKKGLPVFIIYALIKSLLILSKYDVILLGDGVLGIVGYLLKLFYQKPVACIVHGLDLTYQNLVYQKLWVNIFIKHMDKLIAVGNEVINQGILRGIPRSKFVFVPNGVSVEKSIPNYSIQDLEKLVGRKISGGVLLTLGRLVKRKGVAWFIEEVVGNLCEDLVYIVAGDGKEKKEIIATIRRNKLQNRVLFLGAVSEKEKEILFCTTDIFVQPNIKIKDDIEGFGLVVLEAASYGLVVIASRTEGLRDAVHDRKNGILIEERNAERYRQEIEYFLTNEKDRIEFGLNARKHVQKYFSWKNIALEYITILKYLTKNHTLQITSAD